MKRLQQLCLAVVFTVALTTASFAGDIDTPGKSVPPPPPPAQSSATTSGKSSAEPRNDASYEYQLIEDIALELLRTLLSVF